MKENVFRFYLVSRCFKGFFVFFPSRSCSFSIKVPLFCFFGSAGRVTAVDLVRLIDGEESL